MFDLTASRLVRFAMTITGNQSDAEDALQSAFSRIAAKPAQLAAAETPWPYLIRTVRNECLRLLQKKKRMVNDDFSAMAASAGNAQTTVENLAVYEETSEQIRRILRSLPQSQYEVVILKHWEDLTFAEIAEALELPQNTVASRYRYAMEKLQRSLEHLTR
jgi:RNA polymerase sigma-70 factor (ECF subfamily)